MKNHDQRSVRLGILAAISCEAIFGLSYIFTKQATQSTSALSLLAFRFFVAFVVMSILVVIKVVKINFKSKSILPLIILGIIDPCCYFIGETIGIANSTASESGIFLACIPVASLTASTIFLKERPTKTQVSGILVTLVGVLITVFAVSTDSSFSLKGYLFLLIAVAAYSMYSVTVSKLSDFTSVEITYAMITCGCIFFLILAIAEAINNGNLSSTLALAISDKNLIKAILFQGIGCSVFAFFLSNFAIANIGVNKTSSFIGISTVVSVLAGVSLLGEKLTISQLIGGIIIVAGVYLANAKFKDSVKN